MPFGEAVATAFSEELKKEELDLYAKIIDPSRDLAAYEDGTMVGTAASYLLSLKIPGAEVAAAGVTAVGVAPTHRRRGIMSALMRRLHDDAHERGEPLAVLWAAEATIYGRFGYGLATINGRIDADRDRTMPGLRADAKGRVRLVTREEALDLLPGVYDRIRAVSPGLRRAQTAPGGRCASPTSSSGATAPGPSSGRCSSATAVPRGLRSTASSTRGPTGSPAGRCTSRS